MLNVCGRVTYALQDRQREQSLQRTGIDKSKIRHLDVDGRKIWPLFLDVFHINDHPEDVLYFLRNAFILIINI